MTRFLACIAFSMAVLHSEEPPPTNVMPIVLTSRDSVFSHINDLCSSKFPIQSTYFRLVGTPYFVSLTRTNDQISINVDISRSGMSKLQKGSVFGIVGADPQIPEERIVLISDEQLKRLSEFVAAKQLKKEESWWIARGQDGLPTSSMKKWFAYVDRSHSKDVQEIADFLFTNVFGGDYAKGVETRPLSK